jgi:Beta-propeller repeat
MKYGVCVCLSLCLLVAGAVLFGTTRSATKRPLGIGDSVSHLKEEHLPAAPEKASPDADKARAVDSFGRLPLSFEANQGQTDPRVKFLAHGQGYTLFLTRRGEAVLTLAKPVPKSTSRQPRASLPAAADNLETAKLSTTVRMRLAGSATTPQIEGLELLPGKANYFVGSDPKNWRANVSLFAKVNVRDIYPGVDLVYYGNQRQLEYDFVVAPGTDPHSIRMNFAGVKKLSLDTQGGLVLNINGNEIRLQKPRIHQEIDGSRREISGSYSFKNKQEVSFEIDTYDTSKPLVIDPTLSYSTYIGGSFGYGIAADAAGNVYVTGQAGDFPTTAGAFQTVRPSPYGSGFVTKLNPTGSALIYSTYLGGTSDTDAYAIAVDAAGNAYVVGYAGPGFPTTPGAFQTADKSKIPSINAFVTKLNPTGSALVYSTYVGGSMWDAANAIALDATGNAYVTGSTASSDFPTTLGAFQPIYRASAQSRNAFVTKLNADGTALLYSTFLGGSNWDQGNGIALDTQANAYVTGTTCSANFPVTPLSFQMLYLGSPFSQGPGAGPCNAFVTKLSLSTLAQPVYYSTYLGGTGGDQAAGIAVDAQDNAYVAGTTCSLDFPVTPLAFQPVSHFQCDAFVTKLNPAGSGPVYSTYLGGASWEYSAGIAVDTAGNAYVTGITNSLDFPTTPDAFQAANAGASAFLTVLNPSGSAPLVYSTFLGGDRTSKGTSIALDGLGNAYLTGWTYSTSFPTTPGAFQTANQTPHGDGFVAKFSGFPTHQ